MRPATADGAGRLALVTGASAGLGAAFARAYAARRFDVALVARRADRLEALAIELRSRHGVDAFAVVCDLSQWEAHVPVMAEIGSRGREVDVLVNNAGFGIARDFTAVPWARQRDFLMTMAVNACGLAYDVIPGMAARGRGAIINVASLAAFSPGVAGNSLYPGVKSLMVKFSQSLDAEHRAAGLRVTAICPGFTRTEFAAQAGIQEVMERESRLFFQTAEQVAETAIRANERGRVVVVPGWHNKLAAAMLRGLPEPLVRRIIAAGSAKYHLD
ncbi:MAG TPA: SDR family NAD(P)-dependent oxidoreductase [Caulobacteraceae bacterium]|nr:SDR family NAD(P)-dependent oxidoreductase [Caulobacteraceae bacterium]